MNTATNPQTRVIHITSLPYGWQDLPEYSDHVYVGRRDDRLHCDGYFGNPFTLGKDFPDYGVKCCSQAMALHLYRSEFLPYMLDNSEEFTARVRGLSGRVLVASDTCCALVLAYVADRLALLQ